MQHITYSKNTKYPVAILIKSFLVDGQKAKIKQHYVDPLIAKGIPEKDIIVIGLPYTDFKKCTAAKLNESVPKLQAFMNTCGCQHILVADTPYLKRMTKLQNLKDLAGILIPSVTGSQRLFKARVYTTYQFNDKAAERVNMSMDALVDSYNGTYVEKDILKDPHYPKTDREIATWLDRLLDVEKYPELGTDIEGFGLRLDNAGVGTIALAWSIDSGVAFSIDYMEDFQQAKPNWVRRKMLKDFLEEYSKRGGITYYHGVAYDVKNLVANLWMKNDLLDYKNMVDGLEILCEHAHCTKDLTYLATNSAAGNTLNLKHLILEYTGKYAIDVTDITKHPVQTVLEYNLKDSCGTIWLWKKNYPELIKRKQKRLYFDHYQPNQRMLISIEMTGMPLDMDEVIRLRHELDNKEIELLTRLRSTQEVKEWTEYKANLAHTKYQASVKGIGRTLEDYTNWKAEELLFKPTQDQALVWILHEYFDLPIIDKTKIAREPSVADDTLEKHVQWIESGNVTGVKAQLALDFIKDVREYLKITKINGTFVKAFITKSILKKDGIYYLHGGLNQGGTLSGRLSSNDPNLQNLPSGGYWGKAIKRCFKPPPGMVMTASDYAALEARIAAMRTNDPMMRKVFTDGFDSHAMNTYAYAEGTEVWYSHIKDPLDPKSINLIKKGLPKAIAEAANADRSASKPTTFALQFLGTYRTLMNNQGYSEEKSKRLVKAYTSLYQTYFKKLAEITDQAGKDGYITVAYGLRIDAPAISKSVLGTKVTPSTVDAEVRSLSNAVCQSFGQVNTFAARDFMHRVWASKYRYNIMIQALIHDAIYLFGPGDLECLRWINENLIECMTMQMEPTIAGSDVTLEAELDIHYPTWAEAVTIPNHADENKIKQLVQEHMKEVNNGK